MTREHAKQIWPIIKAYGDGKKIEVKDAIAGGWYTKPEVEFDGPPKIYRIVHPEPDLPPGERWSNPEQLTPEHIGEGYRPLTVREHEAGAHDEIAEFANASKNDRERGLDLKWTKISGYEPDTRRLIGVKENTKWTYRVPADTPFLLPDTKPIPDLPLTSTPQGTITEVAALLRQAATLLETIKP